MVTLSLFDLFGLLNEEQYISLCYYDCNGLQVYFYNGMVCDYHGSFDYTVYALRHFPGGNMKIVVQRSKSCR